MEKGDIVTITIIGVIEEVYGDGRYLVRAHGVEIPVLAQSIQEHKSEDENKATSVN